MCFSSIFLFFRAINLSLFVCQRRERKTETIRIHHPYIHTVMLARPTHTHTHSHRFSFFLSFFYSIITNVHFLSATRIEMLMSNLLPSSSRSVAFGMDWCAKSAMGKCIRNEFFVGDRLESKLHTTCDEFCADQKKGNYIDWYGRWKAKYLNQTDWLTDWRSKWWLQWGTTWKFSAHSIFSY